MFFSSRLPSDLRPNALSMLLEQLRRDGVPVLDLTESNPTRVGLRYPPDLLTQLAAPDNLLYEPEPFGLQEAREAVAADFRRRRLAVSPARIVLTSSTSEAYSLLFKLLCNAGDHVLVPVPSYPLFDHLTQLDAVVADPYPLVFNGRWSIDTAAIRAAMTLQTRAVIVVNPNNPTGSFVSTSDLAALRELSRVHGLALIGDEVFVDYPFEPGRVTSVLASDEALTFGLGGLSKTAALPQLKLAWIGVSGPAQEVSAALARLEIICDAYLSVATPVQRAAAALLDTAEGMRSQIRARLRENLETLSSCAAVYRSIEVLPCEAGWSAVLRVPRVAPEDELVRGLLANEHILVHPGYFFDFPQEAFLVVSLLSRPEVFRAGIERVVAATACG